MLIKLTTILLSFLFCFTAFAGKPCLILGPVCARDKKICVCDETTSETYLDARDKDKAITDIQSVVVESRYNCRCATPSIVTPKYYE